MDPLIYDGFVEELVEVLELREEPSLMDIRAAVLRTLTAVIHLERDPRLGVIIEATGAATYHGFLPSLVRDCVATFTTSGQFFLEYLRTYTIRVSCTCIYNVHVPAYVIIHVYIHVPTFTESLLYIVVCTHVDRQTCTIRKTISQQGNVSV